MIKNLSMLLFLAISVLSMQSCKKENGLQSISKTSSSWTCGTDYCTATISIPELTSEIVNNGLVMVYLNAGTVTGNTPLPLIDPLFIYNMELIEVGKINLKYTEFSTSFPSPIYTSFKVVLVENWKSGNLQNIDKNDFKAVSKIASKIIDVNLEK
jgi:hypothetical protein